MAKPRIFVSSTYYDLKHIRTSLENFITEMGYEPILFEQGDIPFQHDLSLDESCYIEIENSHMQVLIIGGRYGNPDSKDITPKGKISSDKMYEFYNSITSIEYQTAIEKGIPVYIFVEKQVLAEYDTYRKNRTNDSISYAHVDSINIFKLIDAIYSQKTGNYIKGFEKFEDISTWLREQWAGLFAEFLKTSRKNIEIKTLSSRIDELGTITSSLKEYTEAIMRKIEPENYKDIIIEEERRINHEKEKHFQDELLINYIIKNDKLPYPRVKTLFAHFKASNNIEEFIEKIKPSKKIIDDLLVKSRKTAEKEFNDLKMRYQNIIID